MKTINEGLINILNEFDQFNKNKALSKTLLEYTGWQFGMTTETAKQAKDIQGKDRSNIDKLSKYTNKWGDFLTKRQNDSILVNGKLDPDNKIEKLSEKDKKKFYHELELKDAPNFKEVEKSIQKMEKVMPKYIKKQDKPLELNEDVADVFKQIGTATKQTARGIGNVIATIPWIFNIVAISLMGWIIIKIIGFISKLIGLIASGVGLVITHVVPVLIISLQTFALFRLIVFFIMLIKGKKAKKNLKKDLENYQEQTQVYIDQVTKDKTAKAISKAKVQEYNNNIQQLSQEVL